VCEIIPLSQPRIDWFILAFFIVNIMITYIVDLEQPAIPNKKRSVLSAPLLI
jgi:hypothetical protein